MLFFFFCNGSEMQLEDNNFVTSNPALPNKALAIWDIFLFVCFHINLTIDVLFL